MYKREIAATVTKIIEKVKKEQQNMISFIRSQLLPYPVCGKYTIM